MIYNYYYILMVIFYTVTGKNNFNTAARPRTRIINKTTCAGFNWSALSYSSLYLINPPPLEGMNMLSAIRFKIDDDLKRLLFRNILWITIIQKKLKAKLNDIVAGELTFQRKKLSNFDEEQAELISARIIQKITNQFANHLKDENTSVDDSIDFIEKVFQIGFATPKKEISKAEEKYKITLS